MKITIKQLLVMLVLAIASSHAYSDSNIDLLIAFSQDSGLDSFEKTLIAERYQQHLSAVYEDQLDGVFSITVWPLITPLSYEAEQKTALEALQWMKSQNAISSSPLRVAREALGSPGADIVLMVAPDVSSNDCGQAGVPPVPLFESTSESESHAFAVVTLEENNPICLDEIVVPHEIGHLLYAEHEVDMNGSSALPDPRNHATQHRNYGDKTLMWGGVPDNDSTNKLSGFVDQMRTPSANNIAFMSEESFNVVAGYRAPELQACNIRVEFYGCSNNSSSNAITATLPGFSVTNADYDLSYNNSSWFDLFEGILTCPSFSSSASMWARAILTTASGQISECTIRVPVGECDDDIWIF